MKSSRHLDSFSSSPRRRFFLQTEIFYSLFYILIPFLTLLLVVRISLLFINYSQKNFTDPGLHKIRHSSLVCWRGRQKNSTQSEKVCARDKVACKNGWLTSQKGIPPLSDDDIERGDTPSDERIKANAITSVQWRIYQHIREQCSWMCPRCLQGKFSTLSTQEARHLVGVTFREESREALLWL